ncbi:MAG: 6-phosphofructokinase, partial [Ruminococcaceae bacterium]|nr:6-phosphofructokinase [Oscillospiraceae bacterium]
MQKTIGVLTSGGDAPGMNAAVRAVTRTALEKGFKVIGIHRGYNGLLNGDMAEMNARSVSDIIQRGGTEIFTARCKEFKEWEYVVKAKDNALAANMAGIVVIGGDGSFRGAADLSKAGIPCVGIPGTIDNDIQCTEYTIGYDTAMNTVMELVDKLRDTSHSHERCAVVEVMGRNAGHIALNTGIACGATAILVPEVEYDINDVITKIKEAQATGKEQFIVVVAEGVGGTEEIAKKIEAATGIESRATILGHVQRGGSPTVR